jgi:hypothetical protein
MSYGKTMNLAPGIQFFGLSLEKVMSDFGCMISDV